MWEWLIIMHYILEPWIMAELSAEKKMLIFGYAAQFPWNLEQMDTHEAAEVDYKNPKAPCGFPSAL